MSWGIGEGGALTEPFWRTPRPRRTGPVQTEAKYSYAATEGPGTGHGESGQRRMPFFGLTVVNCERGALRQSPDGLYLYTEAGCEEMGIETGLDVDRLIEVAKIAEDVVGRPLPGHVMRGGTLKAAKQRAAA